MIPIFLKRTWVVLQTKEHSHKAVEVVEKCEYYLILILVFYFYFSITAVIKNEECGSFV